MPMRVMSRTPSLLAIALVAVIAFAASWAVTTIGQRGQMQRAAPRDVTPRGDLGPDEKSTIDLFQKAKPSVVYIDTRARVFDPWTRNVFSVPKGTGSGFIWDERGDIVTNLHVVEGASEARVRLADGRDSMATLVGSSPAHDLAVLKVSVSTALAPVPIGTSSDLKVGQKVFAIGNPFGLDWTLTTGIVSALDRSLPSEDGRSLNEHVIQTDAPINPGNSGGPLLDSAGRLIGVNAAIFSPSGASAGVGFAIPVDTVNRVVPQLIGKGKYLRPTLGIDVDEGLNQIVTDRLGIHGVAVLKVTPGSGADTVGLRGVRAAADGRIVPGDILVAMDGKAVDSVPRLLTRLDDHRVGDRVQLRVLRDGRPMDLTVVLQGGGQ